MAIEITPGKDGSLSFLFDFPGCYVYLDIGPRDVLHVYHDIAGREKFEAVGRLGNPELLEQVDIAETAIAAALRRPGESGDQ